MKKTTEILGHYFHLPVTRIETGVCHVAGVFNYWIAELSLRI
jgi:hypothetical protein